MRPINTTEKNQNKLNVHLTSILFKVIYAFCDPRYLWYIFVFNSIKEKNWFLNLRMMEEIISMFTMFIGLK